MTLVPTNEIKEIVKKHEELWSKTKDQVRTKSNNSGDYDEIYLKIKFNLDDDLPLIKTFQFHSITIVVTVVFHDGSKYSSQVFLDKCLYKL